MFGRKRKGVVPAYTTIGPDTAIRGELTGGASADITIAGRVDGHVDVSGSVRIVPGGLVEGDVHARDVVVEGTVQGNVVANGQVVLAATARVQGDYIRSRGLTVNDGAVFHGQCQITGGQEAIDGDGAQHVEVAAVAAGGFLADHPAPASISGEAAAASDARDDEGASGGQPGTADGDPTGIAASVGDEQGSTQSTSTAALFPLLGRIGRSPEEPPASDKPAQPDRW